MKCFLFLKFVSDKQWNVDGMHMNFGMEINLKHIIYIIIIYFI
jgi:hypothetical protein